MSTEQQTASEATGPGIGATLRQLRESRGIDVAGVARDLHISPTQVEALEDERFDALPGGAFAVGFLRKYARYLEADDDALVRRFRALHPDPGEQKISLPGRPVSFSEGSASRSASTTHRVLIGLVVLIIVGASGYEFLTGERGWLSSSERIAPVVTGLPVTDGDSPAPVAVIPLPEASQQTSQDGGRAAGQGSTVAVDGAQVLTLPGSGDAGAMPADGDAPGGSAAVAPAPAKQASPSPTGSPAPAGEARTGAGSDPAGVASGLAMEFSDVCWVEVRDGAGATLASQLQQPGSSLTLSGQPPLRVVLGNASAVRMRYRGREVDLSPHTRDYVARVTLP